MKQIGVGLLALMLGLGQGVERSFNGGSVSNGITAPTLTTETLVVNGIATVGAFQTTIGQALNHGYALNQAPTIASGFGTNPVITAPNGTISFRVIVGTGGTANTGTLTFGSATTVWNCFVENLTARLGNVANQQTVIVSGDATSVVVENQTISTGAVAAFGVGDVLAFMCLAH